MKIFLLFLRPGQSDSRFGQVQDDPNTVTVGQVLGILEDVKITHIEPVYVQ